eukprot:94212_1
MSTTKDETKDNVFKEENDRLNWTIGSKCLVRSKVKNGWVFAAIIDIYNDDGGEWLTIQHIYNKQIKNKNNIQKEPKIKNELQLNNKNEEEEDEKLQNIPDLPEEKENINTQTHTHTNTNSNSNTRTITTTQTITESNEHNERNDQNEGEIIHSCSLNCSHSNHSNIPPKNILIQRIMDQNNIIKQQQIKLSDAYYRLKNVYNETDESNKFYPIRNNINNNKNYNIFLKIVLSGG